MGSGSSKKSKKPAEGSKSRPLAKTFFPRVNSPKVLINILDCLYPHEIIALQYSNTYIYEFLNDDMIWMRLLTENKRMHLFTPSHLLFFYPESTVPLIKMPLKPASPLPQQYTSVETLEHRIFLVGGYFDAEDRKVPTGDVQEYLERKARLVAKERMTEERFNCHAAVKQNEIYVMGGENGKEQTLSCEKYIIADNIWITLSFLMAPIRRGLVYAIDDFVYHLEPDSGCIALYTYTCNDNLWDVKSIALPESLSLSMLNFCEVGRKENELVLFGDRALLTLNLTDSKLTYDADKCNFSNPLELSKGSHVNVGHAIYGINQKHLITYEMKEPTSINIIFNYTFEAIVAALQRKPDAKK